MLSQVGKILKQHHGVKYISRRFIVADLRFTTQTSSMSEPRKILVTSALPRCNGSIHLGHMLEFTRTDMWLRFQKHRGNQGCNGSTDVAHGSAIMLRAEKDGSTPEQPSSSVQP